MAAFACDPANDDRWIGALSEVRLLTGGPVGPGTRVKRVARFLGKEIVYVNEIDVLLPGRRLRMHSVQAPFPMTVTYEFEDAPPGTLMRISAEGETGSFYRLAGPLLSVMVKQGISRDLRKLARLMSA